MQARKRIAFDATPLCRNISGVGRYTHNLIKSYAVDNPSIDIFLLCFIDDAINPAYELSQKNIHSFRIPIPRKIYQFTYRKFFRLSCDIFLKRLQLDAIICPNFTIFPYVKKIPSIIVIHDLAFIRYPKTIEHKNLRYLTKNVPRSIKEATKVATISAFTQNELHDAYNIPKEDIAIINCGIDQHSFNGGLKKRQRFILAVGTIEPRKNLKTLVDAYAKLPQKLQKLYPLKIVGAGGWGSDEKLKQANPHIEILGYISDSELKRLYSIASLFVFPSIYEGFGMPILEAFSSNTPVVCSNIPPFKEVAGKAAVYFDPRDTNDMAKKIQVALSSTQQSSNNYSTIVKKWSWQHSALQLQKLIESL